MMIGETFYSELLAAGLVGLPFSWSADGDLYFGEAMTQAQIDAVLSVVAAHDATKTLPVIHVCSPWQIRKALNAQGLRSGVEAAISASTDITLKDGWSYATEFRSDDPFVISMGAALGKTAAETAALIQYASTL